MIDPNIRIFWIAELALFAIHLTLIFYESRILLPIIGETQTKSLYMILLPFAFMRLTRILGILNDNIVIRTYATAILGLLGCFSYIIWSSEVMRLNSKVRFLLLAGIIGGGIGFIISRQLNILLLETISIVFMFILLTTIMILTFRYVFRKSPYVRARQRLLIMSVSYVAYFIAEAFVVTSMGQLDFQRASFFLVLTIPARLGINQSILLPERLTTLLLRVVN